MSLAPETPASIRHRWPPGIFGGLGYLHDHVIFRFNHPVDWPQAMAAEIWHVPKEQSPADAADSQPGETPFSYSWDSPMTTFVSKSIRLINHCANVSVLLGGLWVAVIATSATLCFFGIKSFNEAKSDLQDQARTYAHLIAAHDRYGLTLADALVLGVMDQLEWSDFNLPMSTDRHAKVVEILNRHRARLPGIASFTIIGADGMRRAGVVNKDGTDLSSRGYFQTIKAGKVSYMSNAEDGLASGKTELDQIVEKSLTRAGLWTEVKDRLSESGTALSGGQQQRLCIARAIAVDPEVILMDEPCSALDPIATARIEELIHDLRGKYAIIIVTHNMQQAARVSQRTAFFHLGHLIEFGETSEIFTNPREDRTKDYITGRYG